MKIEIELDEETAACLWANRTWHGKAPLLMAQIVKDVAEEEAHKFKTNFPKAIARTVEDFRAAHPSERPRVCAENHRPD